MLLIYRDHCWYFTYKIIFLLLEIECKCCISNSHFQSYSALLTYMESWLKCDQLFRGLNLGHCLLENIL